MAVIESPLSKALQGGLIQRTVASSSVFSGGLRLNPVSSGPDLQTLAIANQNTSDIISLKDQINGLQQQVYSLVQQNTRFAADIGEINSIKRTLDDLQNSFNSINLTVNDLVSRPNTSVTENLTLRSNITENSNNIISLRKQVDDLREQNRQIILGVTNNITQVQNQINGLQEQVSDFSSALDRISVIIANTSAVDQQREQFQNEQERRSAEIGLRRGKEKAVENRIQEALTEPIKRVGNKLQLGLSNLLQSLYWIFGGWLTNQVINLLTSYSNKDWDLFNKIKEAIVRNTLIAVRGLAFVKTGFFRLIGGIFDLAKMIGRFLVVNPIKALFQGAKNLLTGGGKTAAKVGEEAAAAGAKTGTKLAAEGAEIAAKKGGGKLLRFIPGLQQVLGAVDVGQNVLEGDWMGAGLAAGSMLPGPWGWGFLAGELGYETVGPGGKLAEERSRGISVKDRKKSAQTTPQQSAVPSFTPTSSTSKPQEALVQPQSTMMQQGQPIESTPASIGSDTAPVQTPSQFTTSTPTTTPKSDIFGSSAFTFGVASKDLDMKGPVLAQTEPLPKQIPPGPEPPAKPNIIYTQTGTSSPEIPSGPEPTRGGSVSEVPFIPSSDPDNFYTLYSQVHYNVVTV